MGKNQKTLVVDNGSYSIKLGYSNDDSPSVVSNCIFKSKSERKRVFIGNEISECTDKSSLFFVPPFEKGYLVNWDVQQQIWDKALSPYKDDLPDIRMLLSDPNYLIPAIKDESDEILFEELGVGHVSKSSAAGFCAMNSKKRCMLVVDCGYSCSIVAAFLDGRPIQSTIRRIEIGGKGLTNQLKEWISYRELNVMEETYVINQCKEDCCYVSLNFEQDMKIAGLQGSSNSIIRQYVLPDFLNLHRGFMRKTTVLGDEEQVLRMNHERFALPEALFRPSDLSVDQMGIAEAAADAVYNAPLNLRAALAENVVIIGGSTKFPGFRKRFLSEFTSLMDSDWTVELADVEDPIAFPWSSAANAVNTGSCNNIFVSKKEWHENGDAISKRKFISFFEDSHDSIIG